MDDMLHVRKCVRGALCNLCGSTRIKHGAGGQLANESVMCVNRRVAHVTRHMCERGVCVTGAVDLCTAQAWQAFVTSSSRHRQQFFLFFPMSRCSICPAFPAPLPHYTHTQQQPSFLFTHPAPCPCFCPVGCIPPSSAHQPRPPGCVCTAVNPGPIQSAHMGG